MVTPTQAQESIDQEPINQWSINHSIDCFHITREGESHGSA
jgi:hypothetical protein